MQHSSPRLMGSLGLVAMVASVGIAGFTVKAHAQDQRFAFRIGGVYMEPTGDTAYEGKKSSLEDAGGVEVMFEWYMTQRLGLELSAAGAADVDLTEDNDLIGGVSMSPLTVGLNAHLVRNSVLDWWIGAMGGQMVYGDFDYEGENEDSETTNETTWGVQTALDLSPSSWRNVALNLGVKYLDSSIETDAGDVEVNPLIYRVLLTFRW